VGCCHTHAGSHACHQLHLWRLLVADLRLRLLLLLPWEGLDAAHTSAAGVQAAAGRVVKAIPDGGRQQRIQVGRVQLRGQLLLSFQLQGQLLPTPAGRQHAALRLRLARASRHQHLTQLVPAALVGCRERGQVRGLVRSQVRGRVGRRVPGLVGGLTDGRLGRSGQCRQQAVIPQLCQQLHEGGLLIIHAAAGRASCSCLLLGMPRLLEAWGCSQLLGGAGCRTAALLCLPWAMLRPGQRLAGSKPAVLAAAGRAGHQGWARGQVLLERRRRLCCLAAAQGCSAALAAR
jgi:hypothetical protein